MTPLPSVYWFWPCGPPSSHWLVFLWLLIVISGANDVIYSTNGRFATPKFTPLCEWLPNPLGVPVPSEAGDFYWIFTPPPSDTQNRIMIEFDSIHASPPVDCSNPDTINRVVIKAGPGVNDPVVGSYCLNELPESLWIPSLMGRVEFYTVDYDIYGFLATFHTCKLNSFLNTYI